ncbi:MAG: hypothetical protein IPI97_14195 [Nitrosomonas sp.]|nr:hypothetical protein [Nitrosomonas sp.]
MQSEWDGGDRRRHIGRDTDICFPVDPECYFRTKQQTEINTDKIALIERQIVDIMTAKYIAEGAVKGTKATIFAAGLLVVTSVAIVISLFIAVINGKISLMEFFKIVF